MEARAHALMRHVDVDVAHVAPQRGQRVRFGAAGGTHGQMSLEKSLVIRRQQALEALGHPFGRIRATHVGTSPAISK